MNVGRWVSAIMAVGIPLACSPTEVCHNGIWLEVTPQDTTLAIGESFEPKVWREKCPGAGYVDAQLSTEDTAVVSLQSGRVAAVGAGEALVMAWYGGLGSGIHVEVVQ